MFQSKFTQAQFSAPRVGEVTIKFKNPIVDEFALIAAPKLYSYFDVRAKKNGTMYLGTVVTHLDLLDWCDMHGYVLFGHERRELAQAGERNNMAPRSRTPGNFQVGSQTIIGLPKPAVEHKPMVSSDAILADVIHMIG